MPRRRFVDRLTETDEDRLAAEIREWADTVPGSVRIADAEDRKRVKLAGAVRRITIRPVMGFEGMRLLLFDGTGEVSVVFLGRRTIPGLTLGSRLRDGEPRLRVRPHLRVTGGGGPNQPEAVSSTAGRAVHR
jgi:hypothetical protein